MPLWFHSFLSNYYNVVYVFFLRKTTKIQIYRAIRLSKKKKSRRTIGDYNNIIITA